MKPDALYANSYNPNKVSKPEWNLLETSILEDGWTGVVVARPDGEIVDGFHRWTLIQKSKKVAALTGGLVPVARLEPASKSDQVASTVRHNRARGAHGVLPMAEIVRSLVDEEGLTFEQVMERFGMEHEEVDRLYDRGGMIERGSKEGFNDGWIPEKKQKT